MNTYSYRKRKVKTKKSMLQNLMWIVLAVSLALAVYSVVSIYNQKQQYAAKIAEYEQNISNEEARTSEIKEYSEYLKTKEYKESLAKEKLGLIYPNEILLKPE